MASNRIDADFSEETVGLALETFLSVLSFPRFRISIEPFSRGKERWLGADARMLHEMRGFAPFYMQFKRPSAYPDYSTSKIIKDRKSLISPDAASPRALFFGLRDKQKNHADYQHNVLFRWRNRLVKYGGSDAAYICPLFLERSAYRFHVHLAGMGRWWKFWERYPWDVEKVLINASGNKIAFDRIPVLAEHVSIPPHALVANSKHSYSFSETGGDLCFHSPEVLPDGARRLGDWLSDLSQGVLSGESLIYSDNAGQILADLLAEDDEIFPQSGEPQEQEDGISQWLKLGDHLRKTYAIEQFAFVVWNDDLPFLL